MKVILQSESHECGLACLAMVASQYGLHLDLSTLRRRFAISVKGTSLPQIVKYSQSLEFSSRPLRLELDELQQLRLPCILHWNLNHFVVLEKVGRNKVSILDGSVQNSG
jgi:ATP-binding cassette subfamily B protein RaxB